MGKKKCQKRGKRKLVRSKPNQTKPKSVRSITRCVRTTTSPRKPSNKSAETEISPNPSIESRARLPFIRPESRHPTATTGRVFPLREFMLSIECHRAHMGILALFMASFPFIFVGSLLPHYANPRFPLLDAICLNWSWCPRSSFLFGAGPLSTTNISTTNGPVAGRLRGKASCCHSHSHSHIHIHIVHVKHPIPHHSPHRKTPCGTFPLLLLLFPSFLLSLSFVCLVQFSVLGVHDFSILLILFSWGLLIIDQFPQGKKKVVSPGLEKRHFPSPEREKEKHQHLQGWATAHVAETPDTELDRQTN